jgi:hypothetical protein
MWACEAAGGSVYKSGGGRLAMSGGWGGGQERRGVDGSQRRSWAPEGSTRPAFFATGRAGTWRKQAW